MGAEMIIRIQGRKIDVARSDCSERPCFQFGFDKGSYSQGRGYTDYHTDSKGRRVARPVCMTRHLRGCPVNSVCATCRTCSVLPPGGACESWGCAGGVLVERVL